VNLQVDDTGATAFRRLLPAPPGCYLLTSEGWAVNEETDADSVPVQPVVYSDQR